MEQCDRKLKACFRSYLLSIIAIERKSRNYFDKLVKALSRRNWKSLRPHATQWILCTNSVLSSQQKAGTCSVRWRVFIPRINKEFGFCAPGAAYISRMKHGRQLSRRFHMRDGKKPSRFWRPLRIVIVKIRNESCVIKAIFDVLTHRLLCPF